MADININVNMGTVGGGNFQQLIDSINKLDASFQRVGTSGNKAGKDAKDGFAESMAIIAKFKSGIEGVDAEIKKLKADILAQNDALRNGTRTEEQHNARVRELNKELRQLQQAQRQYNSLLGQTNTQAKSLTNTFNKLGAVLGVSFGLYGAFRVMQDGIKTIASFDLAMKKLQSILGETAEGMKDIKEAAISIGGASIFGAKGVSELQIELAKMGFSKGDIVEMTQAIVNLATATQEDLGTAAEVTANILRAYQLDASETTRITNVMGKSFNDSALDLSNFREAIKYVAPVAAQAGFSFEETVAALELLSQVGIKGSLAGTGLNNVLKAMMDSNSKLSKSLGGTVKGFDGFRNVLQKAKDEGWDTEKIFGVITQRATAAFTTFQNGVEVLDEYKKGLENTGNVMEQQTQVQLQSITNQAKLTKEAFHNLWLEIESGEGILAKGATALMKFFRAALLSEGTKDDFIKSIEKQIKEVNEAIVSATAQAPQDVSLLEAYKKQLNKDLAEITKNSQSWLQYNAQYFRTNADLIANGIVQSINTMAETQVKRFTDAVKSGKDLEEQFKVFTLAFSDQQKTLEVGSVQYRVLAKALDLLSAEYNKLKAAAKGVVKTPEEIKAEHDAYIKSLKERFNAELELLKLRQKLEDEKLRNRLDGFEEEFALENNAYAFKQMIAKKELEMAIALGESKTDSEKKFNIISETNALEHANKIFDIRKRLNEQLSKEEAKLLEKNFELRDENSKDWEKDFDKRMNDINKYMEKFAKDHPIANWIFGNKIAEGLFDGLFTEDDIDNLATKLDDVFSQIGESISEYADQWVEATDRIIDQLNRQVDETQSALETEVELAKAGYANNVTLKKQELAQLKKERDKALQDQRKAQQAQAALDTVTQISNLITAASEIFEAMAGIPVVGVPLAIGLIATMFGAFTAAKVKAFQTASIPKYEKGGWIGGRRHSQGGTMLEAERDEFVINRNSALKHKELVEAINKDDTYSLNKIYLNGLKGQIMAHTVSLDDSKDLKAIREMMEKSGKQVEYSNGYRIERNGSVVKRVKLSN